jgi:hypothetical protein
MCAPKDFSPASFVDTLRVLAVRADKPFAEPGEHVSVEALVADPTGLGRNVYFAYGTCLNPGSGEVVDCASRVGPMTTIPVDADGRAVFGVEVPEDALAKVSPDLPIGTLGIVFAVCAGSFVDAPRAPGAPIGCTNGTRADFMWGVKRVTIITGARNQNPEIVRVLFDRQRWDEGFEMTLDPCPGGDVSSCPSDKQHELDVQINVDAMESYAGRTEDVVSFFYVSQGSLRDDVVRSSSDVYTTIYAPTAVDPSREIELWFVVRDDRGGTAFTKRTARLR